LQDIDGQFQVSDMKHWQSQSYVSEMAIAILQSFMARFTDACLARNSLHSNSFSIRPYDIPIGFSHQLGVQSSVCYGLSASGNIVQLFV
jgi:hypothetical protein